MNIKKAIGNLYKKRLITLEKNGIWLREKYTGDKMRKRPPTQPPSNGLPSTKGSF
ncbi:MAG: hypothetical protein JRJ86_20350 [Deltaproteobacteria bacterium]|nr:hypothetical protein [Deltaproteobacteria bacterium]MBW2047265.1 hypothetical protein [Deltaproteobacteria bacterium]MBW2352695.1 hypothetical protein [Deltaproteobacteria bacterium]